MVSVNFNFIHSLLFYSQPIWFSHFCSYLQDKWRNLGVGTSGQGSRDKSRAPKVKAIVASLPNTPNSAPAASHAHNLTTDTVVGDPPNSALDGKNAPRFVYLFFLFRIQKTYVLMTNLHVNMILEVVQSIGHPNSLKLFGCQNNFI